MVQVTGVPRTPEFMQLIENLVVVLLGAQRNFCGTAHRRSAGRWRARRDSNPRPPDSKTDVTPLRAQGLTQPITSYFIAFHGHLSPPVEDIARQPQTRYGCYPQVTPRRAPVLRYPASYPHESTSQNAPNRQDRRGRAPRR